MLKRLLAALTLTAFAVPSVAAGEAGDLLRRALYDGGLGAAMEQLQPLAEAGDPEAEFALGLVSFVTSIEGLAQDLYKYGLGPTDAGPLVPELGVPVPFNPAPEPLTYDKFRTTLVDLVDNLDAARALLLEAAEKIGRP